MAAVGIYPAGQQSQQTGPDMEKIAEVRFGSVSQRRVHLA